MVDLMELFGRRDHYERQPYYKLTRQLIVKGMVYKQIYDKQLSFYIIWQKKYDLYHK